MQDADSAKHPQTMILYVVWNRWTVAVGLRSWVDGTYSKPFPVETLPETSRSFNDTRRNLGSPLNMIMRTPIDQQIARGFANYFIFLYSRCFSPALTSGDLVSLPYVKCVMCAMFTSHRCVNPSVRPETSGRPVVLEYILPSRTPSLQ